MKRILELGPGTNPRLSGDNVTYLDRKKYLPLPNLIIWDLNNVPLPFLDNTFDECHAYHVLEHVTTLGPLLDDIHRILKPDGMFKANVPHYEWDFWRGPWPDHVHFFSERTFMNLETDYLQKWKVMSLKLLRYGDHFSSLIIRPGHIIRSVRLRRVVWKIMNFWKLNICEEIQVELRPVKEESIKSHELQAS